MFKASKIDDVLSRYGAGSHEDLIPVIKYIRGWWTDRHSTAADLIPVIQAVQEEGYFTGSAIVRTGSFLRMFTTRIHGLAISHDSFRFIPAGRGSAFTAIIPGSQVSKSITCI
ncbi:MAG TPA: hypothetical protein PLA17_08355 [Bacteroidales bacterium]|nr:hypothetical protein [Bacteroidales bacterium]